MSKKVSGILITDIIVYGIIIWFIAYAKIKGMESYEAFRVVVREDGWVEYLTALFLFLGAIVLGINAVKAIQRKDKKQILFYTLSCLVFIFGAGEEISWGQRILGLHTGEYFMEHNYQGETNLHNLKIDGVDLNILVFSKLMFVALVVYFILLPLLTWKMKSFRKLVIDFGVPVPRLHHIAVFFITNIAVLTLIQMKKESELHELALAGILFLIFLNPAKKIKDIVIRS
ncbi:hypothetical protein [Maribellus sp. YY47]|uniref:hypothetical protein n=1 Tax=Maribellus sp. YY47 TaxID=2929486 RepID=UPI002000E6A7|nr:hypothetical protein [Maribellus sp. YY47]MCK3682621.1 hypothetical protein [Maribellus sp. YY47]